MKRAKLPALVALCALTVGPAAQAVPDAVGTTPVLGAETRMGRLVRSTLPDVAPTQKTVDGDLSDWAGEGTRLGGTSIYSRGELVYQDFINDAWGADDGYDAERLETLDRVNEIEPRAYRVDALQQAAGEQFGAPAPPGAAINYGDADVNGTRRYQADIVEARVASDADGLKILVRTMRMDAAPQTAVLVLLDSGKGGTYSAPGVKSTNADWAFLVASDRILYAGQEGVEVEGAAALIQVAGNPSGYTNAIEIGIPFDVFASESLGPVKVAIATGVVDDPAAPTGLARVRTGDAESDLLNVAFRAERARIWMDREQALALRRGSIDEFMVDVEFNKLWSGHSQSFQQLPGYYERIYEARDSAVNFEGDSNSYFQGLFQHYGVYLPSNYRQGNVSPATFWMHYRGGHAHDAAAWVPGILRNFGDDIGGIVITPSARGTSSWYTGRGMIDFLDVWDDAMSSFDIDEDRVYLAGHSMGGWASNLLGLIMPDRWAASNPQDGLLVPGLWAGVGSPTGAQNGADIQAQFLEPMLENARNLPYAILHGTEDELVPVTGAIQQGNRYHLLGYRYRTYLYHAYEHYSAPIWDDWRDVVSYISKFRRDRDPARVTYKIHPALDHAISTISVPNNTVNLGLRFNKAYWVSGLETRTPGRAPGNIGMIDATTHGRGVPMPLVVPDAPPPGQPGVYTVHGQQWIANGATRSRNAFEATLTNLSTATLDLKRMAIATDAPIDVTIKTDGAGQLRLKGPWYGNVMVHGDPATVDGDDLVIDLPDAGTYRLSIRTFS